MKASLSRIALLALAGALLWAGCTDADTDEALTDTMAADTTTPAVRMAVAELEPAGDSDVTGRATFTEAAGGGVQVIADVQGLSEGMHGFHVHEDGDCSNNAQAAGGHFNPDGDPHGAPADPLSEHHRGDMGNIAASAAGTARVDTTFAFLSLEGDTSIAGKALVVHQDRDDLTSQPSGAAGARVACGVIELQGEADDMDMDADEDEAETGVTG